MSSYENLLKCQIFWFPDIGLKPDSYARPRFSNSNLLQTDKSCLESTFSFPCLYPYQMKTHGLRITKIKFRHHSSPKLPIGFFWNAEIFFKLISRIKKYQTVRLWARTFITEVMRLFCLWNKMLRFTDISLRNC